MAISRRQFCEGVVAGGLIGSAVAPEAMAGPRSAQPAPAAAGSHLGNLYPFVQGQADRSPFELSFLRDEFKDLQGWQRMARARVFEHLFYAPPKVDPKPELVRRTDRGDYVEEYLTFQTTPDLRIPAYLLLPRQARTAAPGILVLHSHDGIYLWGKEKVVAAEEEHPHLTKFKQERYGGKSIASELARSGYVTMAIDMFYWGERRMLLPDDPSSYRERPVTMTDADIRAFNQRASQDESLVGRSLFTAGITWPGVVLWDDIRALDYLASRAEVDATRLGCVGLSVGGYRSYLLAALDYRASGGEVDARRLGCVGLSVGGYRSYLLAALDERIKAAVDVGWMTSFGAQIRQHVIHTIGLSFHINGLYRYLDFPDLAALAAPRALMVINGSQDRLFALEGVKAAFDKIGRIYAKAGAPERARCRMFDAPHEFNLAMQAEAWEWLKRWI